MSAADPRERDLDEVQDLTTRRWPRRALLLATLAVALAGVAAYAGRGERDPESMRPSEEILVRLESRQACDRPLLDVQSSRSVLSERWRGTYVETLRPAGLEPKRSPIRIVPTAGDSDPKRLRELRRSLRAEIERLRARAETTRRIPSVLPGQDACGL
jgi:hypothetical protein